MKGQKNVHKKILVLTSTFPRWNGDTTPPFVYELEKRLTDNFDIRILAPHYQGAKKFEEISKLKVYRFQYFFPSSLQKLCYEGGILPKIKKNKFLLLQVIPLLLFEFFHAIKIIHKEKISLVHAHWIIPQGIIAYLVNKFFQVPYVITSHGSDVYGLQGSLLGKLKKIILSNAKKITVVSSAMKIELLENIDPELNIDVVSMGVSSEMFNPHKYDSSLIKLRHIGQPFLLFIGRLSETKGLTYLVDAMTTIVKKFPQSTLVIIGDGPIKSNLEKQTASLNLQKNVKFLGAVSYEQLPAYYATADIFISPAVRTSDGASEGFGLTLVEAAFSGCVPIGTDVGGIKDIIQDKVTGILIKEKDAKMIADNVINLMRDDDLRKKIKSNARNILIELFDWKVVKKKYSLVYSLS